MFSWHFWYFLKGFCRLAQELLFLKGCCAAWFGVFVLGSVVFGYWHSGASGGRIEDRVGFCLKMGWKCWRLEEQMVKSQRIFGHSEFQREMVSSRSVPEKESWRHGIFVGISATAFLKEKDLAFSFSLSLSLSVQSFTFQETFFLGKPKLNQTAYAKINRILGSWTSRWTHKDGRFGAFRMFFEV